MKTQSRLCMRKLQSYSNRRCVSPCGTVLVSLDTHPCCPQLMNCSIDMDAQDLSRFSAAFSSLDELIETVQQALPTVDVQEVPTRRLKLVHTLVQVASMQLHNPFVGENDVSRAKCLAAARSVVRLLDSGRFQQYTFVDPILGVRRLLHLLLFSSPF